MVTAYNIILRRDLHLLYWETTDGHRLFTYNHPSKEEKEHEDYKEKVTLVEFFFISTTLSFLSFREEMSREKMVL